MEESQQLAGSVKILEIVRLAIEYQDPGFSAFALTTVEYPFFLLHFTLAASLDHVWLI